ncbi:hypothetical protein JHK85_019627 [Glycine max]|nr:hypothetical protein JHK85_019627 [Glycine max]KAG5038367.1 hypothetical protein JHK86_019207 [Glycine max]
MGSAWNFGIFAYGQTSSGKTRTMSGITEYAVRNIYEYIEKIQDNSNPGFTLQ